MTCSLFLTRFRLTCFKVHVRLRYCMVSAPVESSLCKNCTRSMFTSRYRCSPGNNRSSRTTATGISFSASLLLLAAVFVPAIGLIFYYRRQWRNSLKNYEAENVYLMPYVDSKTGALVQHQGSWFPVVMFPRLQRFEQIRRFTLRSDDILIVSFPKSGTTWLQQIVWLIVNGTNAENDGLNMEQRFPYIEYEYPGLSEIGKLKSPRLLKSHLPYKCLPAGVEGGCGKVIYIARNAKDVCVSYYHFHRMMSMVKYHGNFADFCRLFTSGRVAYGPWQHHVADYWDHQSDSNVLFLTYEDLHKQPEVSVRKVAEFLGRSLTVQQTAEIVRRTCFDAMKQDSSANYSWWDELGMRVASESQFMRKGIVGDWMNYFTAEMEAEISDCCIKPLQRKGLAFTDRPD